MNQPAPATSAAEDLALVDEPLVDVPDEVLRPDKASLDALNAEFLS